MLCILVIALTEQLVALKLSILKIPTTIKHQPEEVRILLQIINDFSSSSLCLVRRDVFDFAWAK